MVKRRTKKRPVSVPRWRRELEAHASKNRLHPLAGKGCWGVLLTELLNAPTSEVKTIISLMSQKPLPDNT